MKVALSVLGHEVLALHVGVSEHKQEAPAAAEDIEFGFVGAPGGVQELTDLPPVDRPVETDR